MLTWEDAKGRIETLLPRVAAATAGIDGVMIGGTALAFHDLASVVGASSTGAHIWIRSVVCSNPESTGFGPL